MQQRPRRVAATAVTASALLVLAACGGGGASDSSPSAEQSFQAGGAAGTAKNAEATAPVPVPEDAAEGAEDDLPQHLHRPDDPGDLPTVGPTANYASGCTCCSAVGCTAVCPRNGRSCATINKMQTAIAVEKSPSATAADVRLSQCTIAMAVSVQIAWMMRLTHFTPFTSDWLRRIR